jgi:hypothetical protein
MSNRFPSVVVKMLKAAALNIYENILIENAYQKPVRRLQSGE